MTLSTYLTRLIWLAILPLVAFAGWLTYAALRHHQADDDYQAGRIAHNIADSVDRYVATRLNALKILSGSPRLDEPAHLRDLYRLAENYRDAMGMQVALLTATEPMRMLFSTHMPLGSPLPAPSPGNSATAAARASGKPAIGNVFAGVLVDRPLITVAVPILDQGKVVGLLSASHETSGFQAQLEHVSMPEDWHIALLDGKGEVIARRPRQTGGGAIARSVTVPLDTAPWSVRVEIPSVAYLEPLLILAFWLGLGLLAATLAGIGGGLLGRRQLGRAVASLAENAGDRARLPEIEEFTAVRRRIAEANRRSETFAQSQNEAIERERRRIAREVHDQMGQVFTAIKLIIQSIPREAYPAEQRAAIDQALETGIASARRITAELRPPLLDDLGLAAALEHFVGQAAGPAGIAGKVAIRDPERLSAAQALALFRIAQEAVTNTLRHAGATRLSVEGRADAGQYHLRIKDDGRGFDPARVRADAHGLISMRERARLMRGRCKVASRTEGGTIVAVVVPIEQAANENTHEAPAD